MAVRDPLDLMSDEDLLLMLQRGLPESEFRVLMGALENGAITMEDLKARARSELQSGSGFEAEAMQQFPGQVPGPSGMTLDEMIGVGFPPEPAGPAPTSPVFLQQPEVPLSPFAEPSPLENPLLEGVVSEEMERIISKGIQAEANDALDREIEKGKQASKIKKSLEAARELPQLLEGGSPQSPFR